MSRSLFTRTVALGLIALGSLALAPPASADPESSLGISSSSWDFKAPVNEVRTRAITVRNLGAAPTAVSFTVSNSLGSAFSAGTTSCPASLSPGRSCIVRVAFAPTAVTGYAGQLTVTDGLGGSTAQALTGTGTKEFTLSPNSSVISFGNWAPGSTSPARSFTVANRRSVPLTISSIALTNPDFLRVGGTCAVEVPASSSCTIDVSFSPTSPGLGTVTGDLVVTLDGVGSERAAMRGTKVLPLASQQGVLRFGRVGVNDSTTLTATIVNRTSVPAPTSSPSISAPGAFSVADSTCGTEIPGRGSCTITVRFAPTAAGKHVARLLIGSTLPTGDPYTVSVNLNGDGTVTPVLVADPASVDLGDVTVDQESAPTLVTFTNVGLAPAVVSGASVTGDFGLAPGDTCTGATLAPGARCEVGVTFAPTVAGGASGALVVTSNAPPVQVSLAGSGTPQALLVTSTPDFVDFGEQVIGIGSAPAEVTISNAGTQPVGFTGASTFGPFSFAGGTCTSGGAPPTLAPGESCTLQLRFTPTAEGIVNGGAILESNAPALTIGLGGTGVQPPVATITADPASWDFGDVAVATTSSPKAITLTNTGTAPGTVDAALTFPSDPLGVQIDLGTCTGAVLAPSASCTLQATVTPTNLGTASSAFIVTLQGGAFVRVDVTATGIPAPAAAITADPASWDFGDVAVATTSSPKAITLTNTGTAPGTVDAALTFPSDPLGVQIDLGTCTGAVLAPSASCTLQATVTPTNLGTASSAFAVTLQGGAFVQVNVTATGIPGPTAAITADPASWNFGDVEATGTSAPKTITLTNSGDAAATVSGITALGTGPLDVTVVPGGCAGALLAPGGSCTFEVTVSPSGIGTVSSAVLVTFSGHPPVQVNVSATGTNPLAKVTVDALGLDFGTVTIGERSEATVQVSNGSTVPIEVGIAFGTGSSDFDADPLRRTCPAVLPAGETCTTTVRYRPTVEGPATQDLTLTAGVAGLGSGTIGLTASGTGIAAARLVTIVGAGPGFLDYGTLLVGETEVRTFTVTNPTAVPVALRLLSPNAGTGIVERVGGTCEIGASGVQPLAGGASCTIDLAWTPTEVYFPFIGFPEPFATPVLTIDEITRELALFGRATTP